MVESRWVRRIGPGLAALGAVAAIATTTLGARDRTWDPPPCPADAMRTQARPGTWWRLDPELAGGRLTGQRLALGGPGPAGPRRLDLTTESFAAGPFDGRVLVGSDDGRRSTLSLVDPARGCARLVATTRAAVIRRATLTPDRRALIEFRVDRRTRADLGVFRRPLQGGGPITRLLDPLPPDERFGPTWTTEFAWDLGGRGLAVQSCGAIACRTRVIDFASGAVHLIADPSHGDLIGFAGGRLVLHEACGGLPCAVVAVDVASGDQVTLAHDAWQAAVGLDTDGRSRVIFETGRDGQDLRSTDLDGRDARELSADDRGRRLVAAPVRTGGAVELGPDRLVLGPGGRVPLDGASGVVVRRVGEGHAITLKEVSR